MLIPSRVLNVAKAASTDQSRSQLCGVYLEREKDGKPRVTATNGHILVSTTWREDPAEEFPTQGKADPSPKPEFSAIVPAEAALEAAKSVNAKVAKVKPILRNVVVDESNANGTVKLLTTDLAGVRVIEPAALKGSYPDYREAFQVKKGKSVKLNLRRLRDFLDIILKIHPEPGRGGDVMLTIHDADQPVILKATDSEGVETTAVIMPML